MERREMVGVILLAVILSAVITATSSIGVPVNRTSVALAVLIVALVAGVVAALLCLALRRGG